MGSQLSSDISAKNVSNSGISEREFSTNLIVADISKAKRSANQPVRCYHFRQSKKFIKSFVNIASQEESAAQQSGWRTPSYRGQLLTTPDRSKKIIY